MATKYGKIFVFDLELTCWEKQLPDGTFNHDAPIGMDNEIIEIGFLVLDLKTRTITKDPTSFLIKPTISTVSEYCTKITNITPELIDKEGITFPEAIAEIQKLGLMKFCSAGYGPGDHPLLFKDCLRHGVSMPISKHYIDVKHWYGVKKALSKSVGLKRACLIEGIEFKGQQHRAGVDALATAELLIKILS